MRRKSDRFKAEIKDSTEGDARTFIITFTAPAKDFHRTDLFEQRRVIEPLNRQLKQSAKDSIETLLDHRRVFGFGTCFKTKTDAQEWDQ